MGKLIDSPIGAEWLARFSEAEQEVARAIADGVLLVGRDAFQRGVRTLLDRMTAELTDGSGPIALYAEREVVKDEYGHATAYFPGTEAGRAMGPGVPPIVVDSRFQEVGSEGIVAQLITDRQRSDPAVTLSHPGPDRLREVKVRALVVVTDFIGSGKRVRDMLSAFRQVATLRSWHSLRLVRFGVVAYSGTEEGLAKVRSAPFEPLVRTVTACPTIYDAFSGRRLTEVMELCRTYPRKARNPLGFRDSGALIAFAHGCPNNVPPILHSNAKRWTPLFKGRSTAEIDEHFPADDVARVEERVRGMLRVRNARDALLSENDRRWISTLLLLTASAAGGRTTAGLSTRSGLTLDEVEQGCQLAQVAGWLRPTNVLTRLGKKELARLRRRRQSKPVLPTPGEPFYYPTQLRAR